MAHVITRERFSDPRFLGSCLRIAAGECRELAADYERERQGSNRGDQALARRRTKFHVMTLWESRYMVALRQTAGRVPPENHSLYAPALGDQGCIGQGTQLAA